MKQQREQKRWWKLKSEFCIVWKSSFRERKKHKNETLRPAINDTKSPKNVLITDTADQAHPRIHPSASSYIENFCHAVILLINKDVHADH